MVVGDIRTGTQVLVIGGGPGGYVAAIRAAQLGRDVTLVERDALGGVCLNVGCIPSKALISAASSYDRLQREAERGIVATGLRVDGARLQAWKEGVVRRLTDGVRRLLEGHGVTVVRGTARFTGPRQAVVETEHGSEAYAFEYAIVATGSRPAALPGLPFDGERVLDSTGALALTEIPGRLLVVGGGYIGLELGTAFAKLGSRVTVVEMLDRLLPGTDPELVQPVARTLRRLGVRVLLRARLEDVAPQDDGLLVTVRVQGEGGETVERIPCDRLVVAVGRRPNSDDLGLDRAGVAVDARGFIPVDAQRRTSVPHIFAIGDVAGEPLLAHKAMKEGIVAAEAIAGEPSAYDFAAVPAVIFTDPEIAYAGLTERQAREQGYDVITGRFPLQASGRALTTGEADGFVKIVADRESRVVLGGQIVGPHASDLISELVLAIELAARVDDLAWAMHPHPTLGEAVMEAAEAALGRSVHVLAPGRTPARGGSTHGA